jgi:hypothetical protein
MQSRIYLENNNNMPDPLHMIPCMVDVEDDMGYNGDGGPGQSYYSTGGNRGVSSLPVTEENMEVNYEPGTSSASVQQTGHSDSTNLPIPPWLGMESLIYLRDNNNMPDPLHMIPRMVEHDLKRHHQFLLNHTPDQQSPLLAGNIDHDKTAKNAASKNASKRPAESSSNDCDGDAPLRPAAKQHKPTHIDFHF